MKVLWEILIFAVIVLIIMEYVYILRLNQKM